MSVNYYKPYLKVLPEDKADSDLVTGFLLSDRTVASRQVQVLRYAGGYTKARDQFVDVYLSELRNNPNGHLLMVIDFDQREDRMQYFTDKIPDDLTERVFVLGSWTNPEDLRKFGDSESVGKRLAEDCHQGQPAGLWSDDLLKHNLSEKQRMAAVRTLLFG